MRIKSLLLLMLFFLTTSIDNKASNIDSLLLVLSKIEEHSGEWLKVSTELIDSYGDVGEIDKAFQQIQESLKVAKQQNDTFYQMLIHKKWGQIFEYDTREYEKAIQQYDTALSFYVPDIDFFHYANINYKKVRCLFYLSQFEAAIKICHLFLHQKNKFTTKDEHLLEYYHTTLAVIHKNMGQLDSALFYNEKALVLGKRINSDALHATYSNVSNIYIIQGLMDKALEYNSKAIELAEEKNNLHVLAMTLGNRGEIYLDMGDSEKCIEFQRKALKIKQENQIDLHRIVHNYFQLANAFFYDDRMDSTFFYLSKSLLEGERYNDALSIWNTKNLFGQYYQKKGNSEKALHYHKDCLVSADSMQRDVEFIRSSIHIAQLHLHLGNFGLAKQYLDSTFVKMKTVDSKVYEIEVYEALAKVEEKLGHPTQELFWLKKLLESEEALEKEVDQSKILELSTRYETLQKQRAIAELEMENSEKDRLLYRNYLIGGLLILFVTFLLFWGFYRRSQTQKNIIERLKTVEYQIAKTDSKNWQEDNPNLFDNRAEQHILNISKGIKSLKTSLDLQKSKEEELERLIEGLKSYNYAISHDLRKPVQRVKNIAYLLEEVRQENLSESAKGYLHNITTSVEQMEELIESMLSFSQLDGQALYFSTFSMQQLVEEIIGTYAPEIEEKQIQMTIGTLPQLHSDRELWKRIMTNLIENAIKFSDKAEASLIEIGHQLKNKNHLFFIKDNGIGFDEQDASSIFNLFHQLKQPLPNDGLGIGLAIVKKIIERLDGRIWVEPEQGNGASFYVEFPNNT